MSGHVPGFRESRWVPRGAEGRLPWMDDQDSCITALAGARLALNRAWAQVRRGTAGPMTVWDIRAAHRSLTECIERLEALGAHEGASE